MTLCEGEFFLITLKKAIISSIAITTSFAGAYLFCHSTPERVIRSDLFFEGHIIGAFNTDVYKGGVDLQYGQFYVCRNPAIGPDQYTLIEKNGLWYINLNGTGGG